LIGFPETVAHVPAPGKEMKGESGIRQKIIRLNKNRFFLKLVKED
jgi:hypothetical protein